MNSGWIQVFINMPHSRKTIMLGATIDIAEMMQNNPDQVARLVGESMIINLWAWAAQNAEDGDLSALAAPVIAYACNSPSSNPVALVEWLVQCGWLDRDGDSLKIHNWATR